MVEKNKTIDICLGFGGCDLEREEICFWEGVRWGGEYKGFMGERDGDGYGYEYEYEAGGNVGGDGGGDGSGIYISQRLKYYRRTKRTEDQEEDVRLPPHTQDEGLLRVGGYVRSSLVWPDHSVWLVYSFMVTKIPQSSISSCLAVVFLSIPSSSHPSFRPKWMKQSSDSWWRHGRSNLGNRRRGSFF